MQMSRAARWRGSATRGRGAAARLVVIGLIAVGATLTATATAQSMAGTYQGQIDAGPVRVQLVVTGTALAGTLNGPGIAFQLEGEAIGTEAYGLVHTAHGTAEFEAYLDGDTLGLYLFEVDAAGQPIMSTVIELILTRTPTTQQQAPGAAAGLDKWPQDGTSSTQAADPPLASGAYAVLSLDDAVAFIEIDRFHQFKRQPARLQRQRPQPLEHLREGAQSRGHASRLKIAITVEYGGATRRPVLEAWSNQPSRCVELRLEWFDRPP